LGIIRDIIWLISLDYIFGVGKNINQRVMAVNGEEVVKGGGMKDPDFTPLSPF
jgi:hypothetical protein